MKRSAFTLVELLVVIAIIGLLSTIAVVATGTARDRARTAKVSADLMQLYKQIEVARNNYNTTLTGITGGCSDCNCRTGTDLSVLPSSHACIVTMTNFFAAMGLSGLPRDPWGSPYLVDENELEGAGNCSYDALFSAGPNRIDQAYTNDDILFSVPHYQCP
jgi:prepilin-type N-terminal cleavage/methylation domain-containing protein